jgi:prepilin-type N-terminal cleavage/methylation domain-containing protein
MKHAHTISIETERGFTLIEIMLVVAIIGMLAGIATASFVKARTQTQTNICINNLIRIDSAKEQLALEANLTVGATVADASVNAYIKGGTAPPCPGAGTYTYNAIGTDPQCSVSGHALVSASTNSTPASTPSTPPVSRPPPSGRPVL